MNTTEISSSPNSEISAKELILRIKYWLSFLFSKWKIILIGVIIGAALGIGKNKITPGVYIAECNFILDEGRGDMQSGINSLALLGLGGAESNVGLFNGKNLIWLYNSRLMLEKALLSTVDGTKDLLYINWFLNVDEKGRQLKKGYGNKLKFVKKDRLDSLNQLENSILGFAVGRIREKYLNVELATNAENIISVTVTSSDELFAASFSNEIIETVNEYYVFTKTKKINQEIEVIQNKVDSFQRQMNSSMTGVASSIDNNPYPNPNRHMLAVPSKRKSVDVELSSTLFVEMMKNLEARKMTLANETPLIQVLERPLLPLAYKKSTLLSSIVYGCMAGLLLSVTILVMIRLYSLIMNKSE